MRKILLASSLWCAAVAATAMVSAQALESVAPSTPAATAEQLETLDAVLAPIAPDLKKWATVVVVTERDGEPRFEWHHYGESATARDFWPASTIKLYAAVAALEQLNALELPFDTTVIFEHKAPDGWRLDTARTMKEMLSETFRRSSNEDYTLLLRCTGVDAINSKFLVPRRGFPHSALMRGYVAASARPWTYVREEPQRVTFRAQTGETKTIEHAWSGRSYSEERGCTTIDARTGNVTTTRELAECLRRIFFHERIPADERYRLTDEQVRFLRHGAPGWTGLETKHADSGPSAWKDGVEKVFPEAKYFHKCGLISNVALDAAYVDDPATGCRFILVPAVAAGLASKPHGAVHVAAMSRAIAEWVRRRTPSK